jgi:predicted phosphodiesterase
VSVWVSGDTHGDWMRRLNMAAFPEQKEMTKDDYVIICGDFGIWDNSKIEKYNLDWLESRNFTTLFVDGNHSNFDILDALPVEEWHGGLVSFVRPSVIHLKRGQVFEIESKKFFTFGGASSHDISDGILDPFEDRDLIKEWRNDYTKMFRIDHVSWWSRELPSEEEMQNGIENLKKHDNKVDYIITHSPSASVIALLGKGLYEQDKLTRYLEDIKQNTEYKLHMCGHMHIDRQVTDKDILLYEQIIRIL